MARYMKKRVAGMYVPYDIIKRMDSVHKEKADLVSSELSKSSRCLKIYCRDRGYVRRGNSGMVTCQDNICVHENVPGISPDHLQEQTLKTISEDLAEEG
jgi:hypothetical protein